jgi:hypothetical protein
MRIALLHFKHHAARSARSRVPQRRPPRQPRRGPDSDVAASARPGKSWLAAGSTACSGGGICGWIAPSGTPANPFNNNVTSGLLLKLAYVP